MHSQALKGFDYYLMAAHSNLCVMSRTARDGTIDVSVTGLNITELCQETLAALTQSQLDSLKTNKKISALDLNSLRQLSKNEIKKIVAINFKNALLYAFERAQTQQPFSEASEVREFIERITKILGKNIIIPEKWLRQHDSEHPPYTEVRALSEALNDFCQQFFQRIRLLVTTRGSRTTFAVDTAAWVEYRLNLTDHPIADGCGKTAAIVSTFVYMIIGQPIPVFLNREKYFNKKVLPRMRRTENAPDQDPQFAVWSQYYSNDFVDDATATGQRIEKPNSEEEIEIVDVGQVNYLPEELRRPIEEPKSEDEIVTLRSRYRREEPRRPMEEPKSEGEIETLRPRYLREEPRRPMKKPTREKELLIQSQALNNEAEHILEKDHAQKHLKTVCNQLQIRQIDDPNLRSVTQILNYLRGFSDLNDLDLMKQTCLSRESALIYLKCIKLFDIANRQHVRRPFVCGQPLRRTTYPLRACLLEKCPELISAEVFTKTLDINEMNSLQHLRRFSNWVPERAALHAKAYANLAILAKALSKGIKDMIRPLTKPFKIIIRGNTASGKTAWIRSLFQSLLDASGHLKGTLNVDDLKYFLKNKKIAELHLFPEATLGYSNAQVHLEGKAIFASFQYDICKLTDYCVVDGRFETVSQLKEHVNEAKKRGATIHMIDLDVPLSTSTERVRSRTPHGKDPFVSLEVIEAGYISNKKERLSIIKYLIEESTIEEYYLIHQREDGCIELVAKKQNAHFKILSEQFMKCML